MEMRLGELQLSGRLVLAPMAGITDYPFRRIAIEMGSPLVFTEMVSAEGLLRRREAYLRLGEDEHPVMVQLFGSNPEILAEAAEAAESMGADGIDINMGCPVSQVVEAGGGVALMRFPEKVRRIVRGTRRKVKGPLTIKIRSGWDREHVNAVEISKIAEGCGVDGISIHPRTKVQGFSGRADWNLIGEVKQAVSLSVIGNGDVTTPALARQMFEETGCDAVMIGRGALGNPWIFSPGPMDGKAPFSPSLKERQRVIERHLSLLQRYYGDQGAMKEIRRQVAWYTKGLPFCVSLRSSLPGIRERGALIEALESYFDRLQRRDACPSFESRESRSATG